MMSEYYFFGSEIESFNDDDGDDVSNFLHYISIQFNSIWFEKEKWM